MDTIRPYVDELGEAWGDLIHDVDIGPDDLKSNQPSEPFITGCRNGTVAKA